MQEFNRDLSIAVIQLLVKKELLHNRYFSEGIEVLEALSASGLRSVRYAKEIEGLTKIVANDISAKAVESIKRNVETNGVGDIVQVSHNGMRAYSQSKLKGETGDYRRNIFSIIFNTWISTRLAPI